jgi:hypothetical protein
VKSEEGIQKPEDRIRNNKNTIVDFIFFNPVVDLLIAGLRPRATPYFFLQRKK